MSAVTGVLTESLTETLKGFYKLRKAYSTLLELQAAEKKYLDEHFPDHAKSYSKATSLKGTSAASVRSGKTNTSTKSPPSAAKDTANDDDDDDNFEDAPEGPTDETGLSKDFSTLNLGAANDIVDEDFDFRRASTDPIDIFIHSGIAMCFGIFQLVLALLPPPIAKFLAFLSFKGDKQTGLRLLWSATNFKENINGAIAAFVTAVYHNALVAPSDILRREDIPLDRLKQLLLAMEPYCEGSGLYTLEFSRMVSNEQDLDGAIAVMKAGPTSPLRQVEAFKVFESCFLYLYTHQYKECAASFLACVDLNTWAHGMYYYIAAACYIELYREARTAGDADAAAAHAAEADRLLELAQANIGAKKILGRKLPIDLFMQRKVAKWQSRARQRGCALVDAVGVSPVMEMTYLWSGFKKMRAPYLADSLARLAWSEDAARDPPAAEEPVDERALLALLKATVLRNQGRIAEGRALLESGVMVHDTAALKACEHGDDWVGVTAYYERAVCYWQEAGGETGPRALLEKCDEDLQKVEKSDNYDIEVMLGLKIGNARDSLQRSGIGK